MSASSLTREVAFRKLSGRDVKLLFVRTVRRTFDASS
jgi:hypothetical protein